jgi:glycosyltransferase involved in cell wall biosynthesis
MAEISIVIPSFNQSEYLEDAIESCYNQSMPACEILVIDDGSSDDSLEVARRYEFREFPGVESPVRVISQVNKGLPSARNTGIMNAKGDYIQFLDADDMLMENALARIHQEIVQTNADIVAPSFKEFGKSNRDVILGGFTMDDLKQANRLGYFSCVRRSALLEVGGYNSRMGPGRQGNYGGWEDWDLWFDLFKRGKTIAVVQEILVMYRVKEKSMIYEANQHAEELYAQIKKNHPSLFP